MTSPNAQKGLFLKTPDVSIVGFYDDNLKREWCLYRVKNSPAIYITGYMLAWEIGYELSPDFQVATRMIVFDEQDVLNIKAVIDGKEVPKKEDVEVSEAPELKSKVNFDSLINELDGLKLCIDDKSIEKAVGTYAAMELEYAVGMVRHFAQDQTIRKATKEQDDK